MKETTQQRIARLCRQLRHEFDGESQLVNHSCAELVGLASDRYTLRECLIDCLRALKRDDMAADTKASLIDDFDRVLTRFAE